MTENHDDDMTDTNEQIDPDDVEPLSDSEGVYERDGDAQLKPLDWRVIEYQDKTRKFKPYPIPMGDVEELQEMGTDIDVDALCGILADKVHSPDRTADEWRDTDPAQVTTIMEELAKLAGGNEPSNEFHAEVREDLREREAAATGN